MTLPRGYITGHEMPDSRDKRIAKLESELAAALEREARLREALERILCQPKSCGADMLAIARAALAGTTQEPTP